MELLLSTGSNRIVRQLYFLGKIGFLTDIPNHDLLWFIATRQVEKVMASIIRTIKI